MELKSLQTEIRLYSEYPAHSSLQHIRMNRGTQVSSQTRHRLTARAAAVFAGPLTSCTC